MKRSANAVWTGGLKDGRGTFSVGSGAFTEQRYDFRTRGERAGRRPPPWTAATRYDTGYHFGRTSTHEGERP